MTTLSSQDWLVFETAAPCTPERAEQLKNEIAEMFNHPKDRVVVTVNGTLRVIRPEGT